MSIKILNNLDIILYVGVQDDEKLPVFNNEYIELVKEEKEYTLRVSEIYEDFQDRLYKFIPPCVIKIEQNFELFMERRGEKIKLIEEKKRLEKSKSFLDNREKPQNEQNLKEMKQSKIINYYFENLKRGNYVFLNNDRGKYYKIKKILKGDKKIEFILSNLDIVENKLITIDPLKNKLSSITNFKYRLIWYDDRVMELNLQFDINSSFQNLNELICNQIKYIVKSPDYRILYKGEDISLKSINKKIFQHFHHKEEESKKPPKKEKKKKADDTQEMVGLGVLFGDEEPDNEPENEESILSKNEENKDENEKLENMNLVDRIHNAKNLCEINYNFEKDYFSILVPDTPIKTCNLFVFGSYDYTSGWRNCDFINLFVFGSDIKVKNFSICGPSDGSKFDKIDFIIYESHFKNKKYEKENENSSRKYDFNECMEFNAWQKQKVIFEKKNVILKKNFENDSDNPLEKIYNNSYIFNTETIEFSKDKVYAFVWRLKENTNGDYLYYFTRGESRFYQNINSELEIYAYTNKSSYYFLFGFDYKFL